MNFDLIQFSHTSIPNSLASNSPTKPSLILTETFQGNEYQHRAIIEFSFSLLFNLTLKLNTGWQRQPFVKSVLKEPVYTFPNKNQLRVGKFNSYTKTPRNLWYNKYIKSHGAFLVHWFIVNEPYISMKRNLFSLANCSA